MQNKRKGKWQPFDALSGYKESLQQVENERKKIPKPILSEDMLEELNYKIQSVLNCDIVIKYYYRGYINSVEGRIKKIDTINRELYIDDKKIKINNIIDIIEKA
ncbi:MAG TPA: YolD-like family protein [Acholeplasmataceae bacterium]|jgi:hypothetical protein|nr:YolD-like family protein [Acholeplasmataceae bacterium]